MNVSGTIKKEIDISESEIRRITIAYLERIFEIEREYYLDDEGNLCRTDWIGGGSHSWDEKHIITQAKEVTEEQKAVLIILKEIV